MTQNKPEKSALFSKFKWRIKLGVFSCYNLHFKHLLQKAFETFTKLPISLITPWQHWTIAMIIKNIKGWKRPQYPFHNKKKSVPTTKNMFPPPADRRRCGRLYYFRWQDGRAFRAAGNCGERAQKHDNTRVAKRHNYYHRSTKNLPYLLTLKAYFYYTRLCFLRSFKIRKESNK